MIALAAPVVTWAAWPFYLAAIRHAAARPVDHGHPRVAGHRLVHWLVGVRDVLARHRAGVQSVLFMLAHHSVGAIYLDVAAGVTTFLLAGRYFEAWSRQRSGNALASHWRPSVPRTWG